MHKDTEHDLVNEQFVVGNILKLIYISFCIQLNGFTYRKNPKYFYLTHTWDTKTVLPNWVRVDLLESKGN